jgi:hypothetical protein
MPVRHDQRTGTLQASASSRLPRPPRSLGDRRRRGSLARAGAPRRRRGAAGVADVRARPPLQRPGGHPGGSPAGGGRGGSCPGCIDYRGACRTSGGRAIARAQGGGGGARSPGVVGWQGPPRRWTARRATDDPDCRVECADRRSRPRAGLGLVVAFVVRLVVGLVVRLVVGLGVVVRLGHHRLGVADELVSPSPPGHVAAM